MEEHKNEIAFIKKSLDLMDNVQGKEEKNKVAKTTLEYIRDNNVLDKFIQRGEISGRRFQLAVKNKLILFWKTEPMTHVWVPGIYKTLFNEEIHNV